MASLPIVFSALFACLSPAESYVMENLFNSVIDPYIASKSQYIKLPGMANGTLNVNVTVSLVDITSVDMQTGIVDLNLYISMSWIDRRLQWNPAEFDNTTVLYVPHHMLWRPDIVPYRGTAQDALKEYNAVVSSSGVVFVMPKWNLRTRCAVNRDDRSASCSLRLGSWTYDMNKMSLVLGKHAMDLSFYTYNSDWELLTVNGTRAVAYYQCCEEPYVSLIYNVAFAYRPNRHASS